MSEKGGDKNSGKREGFWDSYLKNPFGGVFDFNRNGREELHELWIGHKIYEDVTKRNDDWDDYSREYDFLTSDYTWRLTCEDGTEFGVYPEDYETEEEYEEALNEAKYAWCEDCEDMSETGVAPEDFETEDEYREALEDAQLVTTEALEDAQSEMPDSILAAKDLSHESGSLYTNAVKDQFRDTAGVDPADYETRNEFKEAYREEKKEQRESEQEKKQRESEQKQEQHESEQKKEQQVSKQKNREVKNMITGVSKSEYKTARRKTMLSIAPSVIKMLVFSAFPCIVIWATVRSYDSTNSVCWVTAPFLIGGGIYLLVRILKAYIPNISKPLEEQSALKERYAASVSEEEKKKHNGRIKVVKIAVLVGMLLVIASFITASIVEQKHLESIYLEAETLISEERFNEAEETLKRIEDSNYKDTAALLLLCDAHRDYSAGKPLDAYDTMQEVKFLHQSPESLKSIQTFESLLEKEYKKYTDKLADEYAESMRQEYENKLKQGVPFVGMLEARIGDTSLGSPSDEVRHNPEMKNGESYTANLYDFYDGEDLIFTARCVNGVVTEVWDERDNPVKPYVPDGNYTSPAEPSVDGFSDPEDFYDWYRDDFFDYYDAEDYYYEHGGR